MTSYTVTVAPTDDNGSTTTIIVDVSGDETRITDVHLHAAGGLTATQLPAVDVNLLMQAVAPQLALATASPAVPLQSRTDKAAQTPSAPSSTTSAATAKRKTDHVTSVPTDPDRSAVTTVDVPGSADVAQSDRPAAGRGRRRGAAKEATATGAPKTVKPRARRRAARSDASAVTVTPKDSVVADSKKTEGSKGRAYRRMPDDFAAVARRLNGASVIAEHYEVPRHTAEGWLRRLRSATTG